MRECLERIDERERELRAWAHLDPERAIAQARERDGEEPRGPLHGIPVGVKNIIDTVDMPTSYGSPIYAGRRPGARRGLREVAARAGRRAARQDGHDRVRRLPAAADGQPARSRADAGRLLQRLGRRGRGRDGPARLRHADRRVGDPPRVVLRRGGFKPRHGWVSTDGIKRLSARLDTLGTFGRSVADAALLGGFDPPAERSPGSRSAARRGGTGSRTAPAPRSRRRRAGWGRASSSSRRSSPASRRRTRRSWPTTSPGASNGSGATTASCCRTRCATTSSARGPSPARPPRRAPRSRTPAARSCPSCWGMGRLARPGRARRGAAAQRGAHRRSAALPRVEPARGAGAERPRPGGPGGDADRGAAGRDGRGGGARRRRAGRGGAERLEPTPPPANLEKPLRAASSAAIEHDSSVRWACSASPGPQMIVGGVPYAGDSAAASVKYARPRGEGASPISGSITGTPPAPSRPGSVSIGSRTTRGSNSTSSPSRSPNADSTPSPTSPARSARRSPQWRNPAPS